MMWESLVGPRVRIRLNMWYQRQSNREADIPKRPHFSWTRTCFKCRKKTSATRDLCPSLSHLHFFPVSTNNLPSDDTEGKGETQHLSSFCSVPPHSSVSWRQSVGRRCQSHKKNENTSINCMQCFYFFWYKWYIPIQELQDKSCRVSVIPYNC